MRVLVACEWSGTVRDAFIRRGHDALSCDLYGVEPRGQFTSAHYTGDVRDLLEDRPWDLLIAFPPCTHLAVSGARYFAEKRADGRQQHAVAFVRELLDAPIPRIALENPVGVLSTLIRQPDQIIQPWQFGHPESKATCLWLKGLPHLHPTHVLRATRWRTVRGKPVPQWDNQTPSGQNKLGPSPERAALRGQTYPGIADAMADQWGTSC